MDIILKGKHDGQEAVASLERVLQLFKERYHVSGFCEIHLVVTLLDEQGEEVELVDSETHQTYRIFEVYRPGYELRGQKPTKLTLVVDNTKSVT
jgi:hypothetical protein